MKLLITKRLFGSWNVLGSIEADLPEPADICYLDENKLLLGAGKCVYVVDFDHGISERTTLETDISSLCFNRSQNVCYVIEDSGKKFKRMDVTTGNITDIMTSQNIRSATKYFSKIKTNGIITASKGKHEEFYYCSNIINRCFLFENWEVKNIIGSGVPGYSVSNNIQFCMLNDPQGIAYWDDSVFICDTGNSCIRKVSKNAVRIIAGKPNTPGDVDGGSSISLLKNPTRIKIENGLGYFLDNKKVKYLNVNSGDVGMVLNSSSVTAIATDERKNIYTVEIIV